MRLGLSINLQDGSCMASQVLLPLRILDQNHKKDYMLVFNDVPTNHIPSKATITTKQQGELCCQCVTGSQ